MKTGVIKHLIKKAFLQGKKLTTLTGNTIGHTVDFRKIVSVLRSEGMNIIGQWTIENGKRFKIYFLKNESNEESDKTSTNK